MNMKTKFKYLAFLTMGLLILSSCQDNDDDEFSNKAYINASSMTAETIIKGEMGNVTKTLTVATARPAEKDITVQFSVAPDLVNHYNMAYYSSAELLPDSCFDFTEKQVEIQQGSVKSSEASITFSKLEGLNRDSIYVLPVTINTGDVEVLASKQNYYYIFRAGALINVVPDMEKNYIKVDWKNPSVINNMSQVTFEALLRARDFDRLISTVMGIEGYFLIRIGDAGVPSNQIQFASKAGNLTDKSLQLETNKWYHIAMTYDSSDGKIIFYINGHKEFEGTKQLHNINLTSGDGFYIGRSYEDSRYLCGNICEVRIWNVVRTQEEIAKNPYSVDPTSEGLVAYWKMDDMSGNTVKDYTGNGNDGKSKETLKWTNVSLPE